MPVAKFVEAGQNAMNPAKQFSASQKKYAAGNMTSEEMGEYILMREHSCLKSNDELTKYFLTQKETDLSSKLNWTILSECMASIKFESREFNYLVDHRTDFEKLYTAEEVNRVISSRYSSAMRTFIRDKNSDGYAKLREELLKKNFAFSDEIVLSSDMSLQESKKDWVHYAAAAEAYINKFGKDNSGLLNNVSWSFYENVEDKALLAKAEGWSKRSIELQADYYNYDTYAAVLFKLGKKAEAQKAAESAIELAKKGGDDYKATAELLEKIKALK
jgi:hypothetical protein